MRDMLKQDFEIENPFSSVFAEKTEIEQLFANDGSKEQKVSYNDLLSNIISINKDYKKLNDAYNDVKKMASSYMDKGDNACSNSTLESKLNRYIT